ncbi:serine--tRNA ligase [Candidatus Saccharibacteria bacterium]|nr:serine--tRNA ligase [Candidatus Saccharibacteria bacterium]
MVDIQFIRENITVVKDAAKHKNVSVDIDSLLQLDERRRELLQDVEKLRKARNETAAQMRNGQPSSELIAEGKRIKETLGTLEAELDPIQAQYLQLLNEVPNLFSEDTPLGGEEDSVVVSTWGSTEQRPIKDHLTWLEDRDLVDFERGAKVAGSKFYYSKGDLARLELALTQFAIQKGVEHGFTPMLVPNMVNGDVIGGTGYAPRGEEKQIYSIEGEDLHLIATAEIPLTAYHKDEIIELKDLPLLYVGWSPCYRMEAGAYGKHSKGIFRVHQFYKVEMYVFCVPEQSAEWHEKLMQIEEEILQDLDIPYHKLAIAAGDLGAPAYKKFDLEYFSPLDGEYRELTSCSNVTDYQARRLNIRYRDEQGNVQYVHTLNGTAMVSSRGPIAIIENHQQADGSVTVPEVLRPFMGNKDTI